MDVLPSREEIERVKKICAEAGVEFVGVQQSVDPRAHEVIFNPPAGELWGSLIMPLADLSVAGIYTAILKAKAMPAAPPK